MIRKILPIDNYQQLSNRFPFTVRSQGKLHVVIYKYGELCFLHVCPISILDVITAFCSFSISIGFVLVIPTLRLKVK